MKLVIILLMFPLVFAFEFDDIPAEIIFRLDAVFSPHKRTCIQQSGIEKSVGLSFLTGRILTENDKLKCYIKCLTEKTGMFDERSKTFVYLVLRRKLEFSEEIVRECYGKNENTEDCNTFYVAAVCALKKIQKTHNPLIVFSIKV